MTGRLLVVTYHYIREKGGPYPGIHPVSAEVLSQQIGNLLQTFHPASIQEVSDFACSVKPLERDSFLITFDDGLQDQHVAALDVLNRHGVKGAFFIPTRPLTCSMAPAVHKIHWLRANTDPDKFCDLLNKSLPSRWSNIRLSDDEKKQASEMHIHDNPEIQALKYALNFIIPYEIVDSTTSQMLQESGMPEAQFCEMTFMDTEQICDIASEGHIVAMHGHDHAPLSSFTDLCLAKDLEKNAHQLQQILGYRPSWLSYPYGRPDAIPKQVETLCQIHRIDIAFTLISGFNVYGENRALLKRITPNELVHYTSSLVS